VSWTVPGIDERAIVVPLQVGHAVLGHEVRDLSEQVRVGVGVGQVEDVLVA
jgi:hypothetical protein